MADADDNNAEALETVTVKTEPVPGDGEIVAVGTVSHVIRRAFQAFYPETLVDHSAQQCDSVDESVPETANHDTPSASTPRPDDSPPPHPFLVLGLARKQAIESNRQQQHVTGSALLEYLETRHSEANAADEAIAADLRRHGLVIKAQIPLGPTNLRLDAAELEVFGAFGSALVHAHSLVAAYHRERRDKSGNGPNALERQHVRMHHETPGYLSATSSSDTRKDATLTMHRTHIETVKTADAAIPRTESSIVSTETIKQPPTESTVMPAPEYRKNMDILERMQMPLDFVRNPRFATPSATESSNPSFAVIPNPVVFTDYDADGLYEQLVYVRNTSTLSRRVRVLPPSSLFFALDRVIFPDASGLVAPGMLVQVRLRFHPDSRAGYKDSMTVQYEGQGGLGAEFVVPITAQRPPPELSIPLLLRTQPTLVGQRSVTTFDCRNSGGKARFWLMSEDDWRRCESSERFEPRHVTAMLAGVLQDRVVRIGPFILAPNEFELATNERVPLNVTFLPSSVGELRAKFVMVCDNCLVRVFQLAGRGCQVELSVTAVNGRTIDASIARMAAFELLRFHEPIAVNATASQAIEVTNETPLPLPFDWRIETKDKTVAYSTYAITPPRGVLPANGSASFVVRFAPSTARLWSQDAVLYLEGIPECSVPGPKQLTLLQEAFERLKTNVNDIDDLNGSVQALTLGLRGVSRLGGFKLVPRVVRCLEPGDEMGINTTYTTETTLTNDENDCAVGFEWVIAPCAGAYTLSMTPSSGLLPANGSQRVQIAFTPHSVGTFSIPVVCRAPSGDSSAVFEQTLCLEGIVAAPRVSIVDTEVDFGLVLVSGSAETSLTLLNPSQIATAQWKLVHLEAPVASALETNEETSPELHRSCSKESIASRRSSGSSTSSALMTGREALPPRASVRFVPPTGSLLPNTTQRISINLIGGALPERFRGKFACEWTVPRTFPGFSDPTSSVVSARAELQSPSVFLSPLRLALGTTYVGVSVESELRLVNVSNLEADFKFFEPNGVSKAYSVAFSPRSGVLHSKETLVVRITYTPRQAGKTTTLFACVVQGLPAPLGVEVSTMQRGLVLQYEVLGDDVSAVEKEREPLIKDDTVDETASIHAPPPKLAFGDAIPLGERRHVRLLIRNRSGIDALVALEPKKYRVAIEDPHSDAPSTSMLSSSSKRKTRVNGKTVLGDRHEHFQRFQSESGRNYIRQCDTEVEDRRWLADGRGIAFLVAPEASVRIPAWTQRVVTLTCVNNMPGEYTDALVSRAQGLPPVMLPLHASIVGSPLTLDRNCVGLHVPPRATKSPSFTFGSVSVRSSSITKTLRVMNRGPDPARLRWRLAALDHETRPRVTVTLRVDFSQRVQLRITPTDDEDDESNAFPFEVVPPHLTVPPFASSVCKVTFFPSTTPLAARVLLLGEALWLADTDDEATNSTKSTTSLESISPETDGDDNGKSTEDARWETTPIAHPAPLTAAGKAFRAVRFANALARSPQQSRNNASSDTSAPSLRVLLKADVVEPELFLDQPSALSSSSYHLKFTTWSTLVSAHAHASHRRECTLMNHLNARVTFRLECTGPFAVMHADSLAPKHPLATADLPPAHRRAEGESFVFTLPPQMSVRLTLRFDPSAASTSSSSSLPLTTRVDGALLVRFTNQSVQRLQLCGEILAPVILVSPSVYSFGHVHLSQTRSVLLYLTNPTVVPASFTIRHVPRPTPLSRAQKQEMATHHAHFEDDPSVFTLAMTSGTLEGPTLSLRSSGSPDADTPHPLIKPAWTIRVVFRPKKLGAHYKSRFRICVTQGVDAELILSGQGHLDESERRDHDRVMVRTEQLTHSNIIFY